MDLDVFTHLIGRYGPELEGWPDQHRRRAMRLRDESPEARAIWERAIRADSPFRPDHDSPVDPVRATMIVNAALRRIRSQAAPARPWAWLFSRPVGAAFAGMLVAGWFAGVMLAPDRGAQTPSGPATPLAAMLDASAADITWLHE